MYALSNETIKTRAEQRNDVTKNTSKFDGLTFNEGQVQRSKVKVKVKGQGSRSKAKSNIKFKIPYYRPDEERKSGKVTSEKRGAREKKVIFLGKVIQITFSI